MAKHTKRKVIGIATLIVILNLVFILIIFQLGRVSILDDTQWIIDGYEIDGEFTALIVGNRSNTFTIENNTLRIQFGEESQFSCKPTCI